MANLTNLKETCCFGGRVIKYQFTASTLGNTVTKFNVFIPGGNTSETFPTLYYLSGLTCTEDNFFQKGAPFRYAAEHKLMLVGPDTSPRGGMEIKEAEANWDFGTGAGFYITATRDPYKKEYNMYDFVTKELQALIDKSPEFPSNGKKGITGHSMGGHGALICHLKNPGMYLSVSAFSPICNPMKCPWGQKAFKGYLVEDEPQWAAWDACELLKNYKGPLVPILISQGKADNFLTQQQLLPENFVDIAEKVQYPVQLSMEDGYDHGYYFISTFIEQHIKHAAKTLNA